MLEVEGPDGAMLGSPLALPPFAGLEGFVEARDGGVAAGPGTPADPGAVPVLARADRSALGCFTPTAAATGLALDRPLARPRRFELTAAEVAGLGEPLSRARAGRAAPARQPARTRPGAAGRRRPGAAAVRAGLGRRDRPGAGNRPARAGSDVVIPVYRGAAETLACIDSVLASAAGRHASCIVVEDASPEPELRRALDALAAAAADPAAAAAGEPRLSRRRQCRACAPPRGGTWCC